MQDAVIQWCSLPRPGGAGTSVFAAMVAWRLAQRKLQCALVDCDFAAGGIDVLLGIENEPGLRFQTVDIPLGKTEGAALNGELPQWERVGVARQSTLERFGS